MMPSHKTNETFLTLGWRVSPGLEPHYWLQHGAKCGLQPEEELIKIRSRSLATHTALIAQSGSGKSFFLGRLVEEILINTKARCVVLDPNADFRKAYEVVDDKLWSDAKYDVKAGRGMLPHEPARSYFLKLWSQISIRIRTANFGPEKNVDPLQLWWSDISVEFLAEDLDPRLRSDLYHLHSAVRILMSLLYLKKEGSGRADFIGEAERLFGQGRGGTTEDNFRHVLQNEFNIEERLKTDAFVKRAMRVFQPGLVSHMSEPWAIEWLKTTLMRRLEVIVRAPRYVSNEVEHFYFGKAREYEAAGILKNAPDQTIDANRPRLDVIDLPSLRDRNTRLLVANSVVSDEWNHARTEWFSALQLKGSEDTRVPTFIIIDEAHNLVPADPRGKAEAALKEQFRTIIAEGRKYGLFLILVTQRPEKLDPLVLSECENKAIMRLGSLSVLSSASRLLGLEDVPQRLLEKSLEFGTGRVLLLGQWAPQPQLLYGAARRTAEGGRNLRDDQWAVKSVFVRVGVNRKGKRVKKK